ncbi:MAG: hypothetical protein RJA52_121 [Bacteroidota bacterium]|jgi:hypothetical protein
MSCTGKGIVSKEDDVPLGENWINIHVISTAGKYLEGNTMNHFPAPFNLSKLNGGDEMVFLISESIPAGTNLKSIPIGFIEFGIPSIQRIIVAIPLDEDIKGPRIKNFRDLLFDYESMKRMLENWLIYSEYPEKFSYFQWKDELSAMQWLKEKYL